MALHGARPIYQSMNIQLGREYRDKITGLTGICTGKVEYISGCAQALIQPQVAKDGAWRDSTWLDQQRLMETDNKTVVVLEVEKTPGFDKAPAKR